MKRFGERELKAALAEAKAGGQSLWLGKRHAWIFDADLRRLVRTAKSLRVAAKIRRAGKEGQCVEIPQDALDRALDRCNELPL